ncbi:Uracil-DNA glycosylase superfamily (plasmid) [Thioalkalivibrio sp. K90mix]|uniref:uracil-DNA glycosylase n=1 Tax=Thioalkalivibrio sp. (strain K90mix) TaxID=396595 RepID=UPI000195A3B0|nr:uracil-DNA glycosylase [Thioalkalivibrio sp. K90mix]ADC73147.1 Uracil-DNA glycosylase superfamily [Thioalkalivibrio sp. K90mix]
MITFDCQRCRLHETAEQVVNPDGARHSILAVGEGPGAIEDDYGVGFVGTAGQTLEREIRAVAGLGRQQWARANIVRCRPPDNRKPRTDEVSACAGWLDAAIDGMAPRVILAVGESAGRKLANARIRKGTAYLGQVHQLLSGLNPDAGFIRHLPHYRQVPVVPMPHTSGLAWNRRYRPPESPGDSRAIAELGRDAILAAYHILRGQ